MPRFPLSNVIVMHSVSLCGDCITLNANGWDEDLIGYPMPDPAPMNLLRGYLVAPDNRDHDCEGHVSSAGCDGCGGNLGVQQTVYCYRSVKR